ncbi:MAG: hypothetical protein M3161_00320 [Actinomycetota bacterium]|nr:hypothetical protein [Actinomycetota bacterium]
MRRLLLRVLWPIVIALVVAACTGGTESPPVEPARVVSEDDDCPDQREIVTDGDHLASEASADVDGDGTEDEIYLVRDDAAPEDCRAFLVVATQGEDARVVSEPVWRRGSRATVPEPRIHSVVQIDGEPGIEIVVDEAAGASTRFAGAFTFDGDALERIAPAEPTEFWSGAEEFLFPYGGSVGHIEGADCADQHDVVVSVALPAGPSANTYAIARRFFDLEGAELVERDLVRTVATADDVFEDFPEFRASPFGSCPS